jgi:hypothetical protein
MGTDGASLGPLVCGANKAVANQLIELVLLVELQPLA